MLKPDRVSLGELVVCSLEPWDDVWRRNQIVTDALLRRDPALRVLFVEPPSDPLFDISRGRHPTLPGLRSLWSDRRLQVFRPFKPLPRRLGPWSDRWLRRTVVRAIRNAGFVRPTLWLNDATYAPLIPQTGWPSVYDVTDDWLLSPCSPRELTRQRELDGVALTHANEVIVCSRALAASRGRARPVTVIPNAVDCEHYQAPRARPDDLPAPPTAVYVGTLHESRLDVDLVLALAQARQDLAVVLVGPDALSVTARRELLAQQNIHVLGARPYAAVPAYLQHASVLLVPHVVTPFTDSLDPIKAYECLAVDTPAVATPVAGFRELAAHVTVVPRDAFVAAVAATLDRDVVSHIGAGRQDSWEARLDAIEDVLWSAARKADPVVPC